MGLQSDENDQKVNGFFFSKVVAAFGSSNQRFGKSVTIYEKIKICSLCHYNLRISNSGFNFASAETQRRHSFVPRYERTRHTSRYNI